MTEYKVIADDGFYFGIGLFETIFVQDGECHNLSYHLTRLKNSADKLGLLPPDLDRLEEAISAKAKNLYEEDYESSRQVLKVTYTKENLEITSRAYSYTSRDFARGFVLKLSPVLRNETSPFTYVKSLNYGDNILEKRRAHAEGFDEPYFLNSKGELTEGATSNLFLIKDGQLFTPSIECGLLAGTMREFLLDQLAGSSYCCHLKHLTRQDLLDADEVFITNALLGIMPVCKVDGLSKDCRKITEEIKKYAGLW